MEPYEWMTTFTPQKEWIEKKGFFMPLAFYLGALGGGLYLLSLYFHSLLGMFIAWLLVAVFKGCSHFVDLGRPFISWRMVLRPQSSWISRGLILVLLFAVLVPIQLCLSIFFPGTTWEAIFKVIAGITALGICVYPGFTLTYINAIPLWNSVALPILFLACGLLGGSGLLLAIGMFGGNVDLASVAAGGRILLIITSTIIIIFISSISSKGPSGKKALQEILRGSPSLAFWAGVVLLGIVTPFLPVLLSHMGIQTPKILLLLSAFGETTCGLSLTYVILKAGAYSPLIPASSDGW